MTADEYLQSLINRYRVPQTVYGTAAYDAANAIYPIIHKWANIYLRDVSVSGSNAKGTAIRGKTDVDLFISLKSDTKESLKDIFTILHTCMIENGYQSAQKQNVSVHVLHHGIEVDLVPAVNFGGNSEDHWLYVNRPNRERTKTNVAKHIALIQSSGRTNEIIITKIWRQKHRLDFPSFYLEIVVLEALKYKRDGFASNFMSILEYLSTSFESARFLDPANSNNIISDDLTDAEKKTIATQAQRSKREQNWGGIVW